MLSGRARVAVCAAAATILTACSLLPLVSPASWLFQAMLLLLAQTGVGQLARRVPLPRAATVLAQALVSLELLTLMFARPRAIGGLLPGPHVLARFGELVTIGVQDVGRYAIPAPVTPGIRLMLVGGVVLVALMVDALAVTYDSAAPAGLPLLALYSIAAGLSGGGGWLWFLTAACGYLLLLLAEGRDRLSRWGRVFGGPPPSAPSIRTRSVMAPVRTGRRIGAMALGIALIAPAVLPSLNGGLLAIAGTGTGMGQGGGTISAVNPVVALQNQLSQPDNRQVLNYRTDVGNVSDMYLRFVALDQFNGTEWTPSKRALSDVPNQLPLPQGLGAGVQVRKFTSTITADRDYAQMWLPLPYPAEKVEISGRWRFEPEGRTLIGDQGQTTQGMKYRVTALEVEPTADQLASAPKPDAAFLAKYTKVPGSLPSVVGKTARQVTSGQRTDYGKAVALQDWFTSGAFMYSTSVQSGTGVQAITRFLREKKGFCIHFAFTMAAMARTLGIPARVAVGFTPGTPEADDSYSIGLRDAHAWPELYFQGVGWTRFEPTPTRGTVPQYTLNEAPPTNDDTSNLPSTDNGADTAGTPAPSSTCDARAHAAACVTVNGAAGNGSAGSGTSLLKTSGYGLLVLLALLVPVLPMALRHRVRRRRLDTGEPLAAWRELVDTGWDHGVPPNESETPRRAVARLVRDGGLVRDASQNGGSGGPERSGGAEDHSARLAAAAEAARRVATAVEQTLYAPYPGSAEGLSDDVRRVKEGLHAAATPRERLRALVLPRSSIRVLWQLAGRGSALTGRLASAVDRGVTRLRRARA
jgi:transglutaminase-like putative cysteine protease